MISNYHQVRNAIEKSLCTGKKDFIIFPYGENGVLTKHILNDSFGIEERYIIDNRLSVFNSSIKKLEFCARIDRTKYTVLFTCSNPDVYESVWNDLNEYFPKDSIVKIFNIPSAEKQNAGGGINIMEHNVENIVMDHCVIIGWLSLLEHFVVLRLVRTW